MENFITQNPTKLIFGKGSAARISGEIPADARVMVLYGGGSIKKNGAYDDVMAALRGRRVTEFGGIEPNPKYETLMKAVEAARAAETDYLLAVGGGSIIDGTKFIACALRYDGANPWDFLVDPALLKPVRPLPLAAVLTLPATGSEMNNGGVISRYSTGEKLAFHHNEVFPRFSVLDPCYCFTLPDRQVANGIVDTFAHVLEQYLTYPSQAMVQDRFAEGILLTLKEIAQPLMADHTDYDLMSNFMIAATMGLNGYIAWGVPQDWATHMIGHELTALHGLDHGVTLAIVYPALMQVLREPKAEKLLQYGERVWNIDAGSREARIDATIARTRAFFESLGIRTRLSDYGIGVSTIDAIVKRFSDRGWKLGERADVGPDTVRLILEAAM